MATDITPPARWVPRCLECRHPTTRHGADCTVGRAVAAQLELAERAQREADEAHRNHRLQVWAALRWRRVVVAAAAERTARGIVIVWVVFFGGDR